MTIQTKRSRRPDVKTIQITDETYGQLESLRRPRDSFNSILRRLLRLHSRFAHLEEPDPRAPSKT